MEILTLPVRGAKEDSINNCPLFSRVTMTCAYLNKCMFLYLILETKVYARENRGS